MSSHNELPPRWAMDFLVHVVKRACCLTTAYIEQLQEKERRKDKKLPGDC